MPQIYIPVPVLLERLEEADFREAVHENYVEQEH